MAFRFGWRTSGNPIKLNKKMRLRILQSYKFPPKNYKIPRKYNIDLKIENFTWNREVRKKNIVCRRKNTFENLFGNNFRTGNKSSMEIFLFSNLAFVRPLPSLRVPFTLIKPLDFVKDEQRQGSKIKIFQSKIYFLFQSFCKIIFKRIFSPPNNIFLSNFPI